MIHSGPIYTIPNIWLVGFGRTQVIMHECFCCKEKFFPDMETDLVCTNCKGKEFFLPNANVSKFRYRGVMLGWHIEVEPSNKRSTLNLRRTLYRDQFTCQYCGYTPALYLDEFRPITVDHIQPFGYLGNNSMKNLVACCQECNSILGSRIFPNFSEKKEWLLEYRKRNELPTFWKRTWASFEAIANYSDLEYNS